MKVLKVVAMGVNDVDAVIAKKWNKFHESHASVSTMVHKERSRKTSVILQEMMESLKLCRVCQRICDKRRSSVSIVNYTRFLDEVVGVDFVGPIE